MKPALALAEACVLVSGAAGGIGRATARAFAQRGAALHLVDRDAEALERACDELRAKGASSVSSHTVDVANVGAVDALAAHLAERRERVDVLVNAAGVALVGSFLDTSLDDWAWVLGVNLQGTILMSRAFAPGMVARRRGHIVNVASAAAFFAPGPLIAYGVSKAAVVSFSETLRADFAEKGVGVSVICPGFVDTPILENGRLRGEFEAAAASLREHTTGRGVSPVRVADAIVDAVLADQALVTVTAEAKALYLLKRLTPSLLPALVRALQKLGAVRSG